MNLKELNELNKAAGDEKFLADKCTRIAASIAKIRGLGRSPEELMGTLGLLNGYNGEKTLVLNKLGEYLPDAFREVELTLAAEARAHRNNERRLRGQLNQYLTDSHGDDANG